MSDLQTIFAIMAVFLLLGVLGWLLVRGGLPGEREPEDTQTNAYLDALERQARDHDGETTPGRYQWKNAGAKAHHAEP